MNCRVLNISQTATKGTDVITLKGLSEIILSDSVTSARPRQYQNYKLILITPTALTWTFLSDLITTYRPRQHLLTIGGGTPFSDSVTIPRPRQYQSYPTDFHPTNTSKMDFLFFFLDSTTTARPRKHLFTFRGGPPADAWP